MKKLIFLLLLLPLFGIAQIGIYASTFYSDKKVNDYLDTIKAGSGLTLSSTNIFKITRFWKDIQGHANPDYSTALALSGRFDTCYYLIFLITGTGDVLRYEFIFNNFLSFRLNHTGSPTLSDGFITYNGTTQYSEIVNGSPATILSTYGKANGDTTAQTNFNIDVYARDSANQPVMGSYVNAVPIQQELLIGAISPSSAGGYFAAYSQPDRFSAVAINNNRKGLWSLNRNRLYFAVHHNGIKVTDKTNASYNFNFAYQNTFNIGLGADLGTSPSYAPSTIGYAAVRRRAFSDAENALYSTIVNAFKN